MKYSISIVSHGNGRMIFDLLRDLNRTLPKFSEIILTINFPEDEAYFNEAFETPLRVIRNKSPLGFGENHNQAFRIAKGRRFVILNPDVRVPSNIWSKLDSFISGDVGACAPMVLNSAGGIEDSARQFPTLMKFIARKFFGRRESEYLASKDSPGVDVDWVAGMFIMFDSLIFKDLNGFDEKFFMYLEDADICRRIHIHKKRVLWVPNISIVHDAQRASGKSFKYFFWHLVSARRFICKSFLIWCECIWHGKSRLF